MAGSKTSLRELSVAVTIGLLRDGVDFRRQDLYDPAAFLEYAGQAIVGDIAAARGLLCQPVFAGEYRQIVDNGYQLGRAIFANPHFQIKSGDRIAWLGNDTQKDDPIDIAVGDYKFSLKEDSFILENMGLYRLLNCYTGSCYRTRHIFSDYARAEYEHWFAVSWGELLAYLQANGGCWQLENPAKGTKSRIALEEGGVRLESFFRGKRTACNLLPLDCTLAVYEISCAKSIKEYVFARFINRVLAYNRRYNQAKKACAVAAAGALAAELNRNLNYDAGLPRFLRIHSFPYYYAKTTVAGVEIYRVPDLQSFKREIVIEAIEPSVPDTQANILTTIRNVKTGGKLVLRNECRFSHGQFNGVPEAKMYYAQGGSLLVIYEPI